MKKKIAILQFPGINREYEAKRYIEYAGLEGEIFRWNRPSEELLDFDGYVIPGGFSYEDRSRAGVIASLDPLMNTIREEAAKGKPVLGICNGCQILMETGLVPGLPNNELAGAMAENVRVKEGQIYGTGFYNDWIFIKNVAKQGRTIFNTAMEEGEYFRVPVANGEGKFMIDKDVLKQMYDNDQVILKYSDAEGKDKDEFPYNPSGAEDGIAGICNPEGNVMALMPHPENSPEGMGIFNSLAVYLEKGTSFSEGLDKKGYKLESKIKKSEMKEYKLPKNCTELIVDLIITDNEARTVATALKNIGFDNVDVERKTHWELCYGSEMKDVNDLRERIVKSDELLNTNKEFVMDELPRDDKVYTIKVAYKDDYVGRSKTSTLKNRLGFNEIADVKKSIIWQIKIDEDDVNKREEILKKVMATNIFYNPFSQECKIYP
ncbi:phosphoribosylformylglycinamidine synthase I [Patescibacteria group bacterium]|nr:phosphoribosylformylglycinamidine synthase I [Patescibacteria group bacterium]MBU1673343.1 phosphoribosylformylglycinamidine synthase I [Patescibacteria group bacterium]MBU1963538.1 phosphoribosylformylglycinamidine synthase I [Patescibacteria group bacterium]